MHKFNRRQDKEQDEEPIFKRLDFVTSPMSIKVLEVIALMILIRDDQEGSRN